jgi:hypothetical protein
LAIWFFAQAVIQAVPVVMFLTSAAFMADRGRDLLLGSLMSAAIPLAQFILGVLLWLMSDRIAQRMVPREGTDAPVTPLDVRSATSVAAVAVGLLLAIPAIQNLVKAAYIAAKHDAAYGPFSGDTGRSLGSAIQPIFSIFLILGSHTIANLIHRPRTCQGPAIDNPSSD